MGRAHEVRAKKIAQTNAAKSSLYNRASKEIYIAAKSGVPDPNDNLALRSAIEKWKAQHVTRDVIDRAIEKAKSKDANAFVAGRYEGFGPAGVAIMVDTLTDNDKRAYSAVRAAFSHHGGNIGNSGCAAFNFTYLGVISFDTDKTVEEIEDDLILNDIDVQSVDKDETNVEVITTPASFEAAKAELEKTFGIQEFTEAEVTYVPQARVTLSAEDKEKVQNLIDSLDEIEDVQAVYHNADL
ncbi:MAG: YebC/PmpR family DNA-binding transcriptional regulator [Bacilli bacterium]|jgi:YebC/PmpR family DNA-binding regulatory protein|nr:YebC/PmpR family DNA-binding transcriptional regulator [Bacilli bacterium]